MNAAKKLHRETLSELSSRLRKMIADTDHAEFEIASLILDVRDNWEFLWRKQDPKDRTFKQWMVEELRQRDIAYYERTVAAKEFLGSEVCKRVTRDGALRIVCHAKTKEDVDVVRDELARSFREDNGSQRLTEGQVHRLLKPIIGSRKRGPSWQEKWRMASDKAVKAESRLIRLETQIRKLGAEPVE